MISHEVVQGILVLVQAFVCFLCIATIVLVVQAIRDRMYIDRTQEHILKVVSENVRTCPICGSTHQVKCGMGEQHKDPQTGKPKQEHNARIICSDCGLRIEEATVEEAVKTWNDIEKNTTSKVMCPECGTPVRAGNLKCDGCGKFLSFAPAKGTGDKS